MQRVALPLLPALNKISTDVKRADNTIHTPVTPEAMAIIFYYSGLMFFFSHYAEILTLSLDGASENGRVGPGGEAMCGRNSQMDRLMIKQEIWREVESHARDIGIADLTNRFYKNEDPAGLLDTLVPILRDFRRDARAASQAKKKRGTKNSCDAGTSLTVINEVGERGTNTAGVRTADVADCMLPRESGSSDDRGTLHLQERSPGESSNMSQGGANTAGVLQQNGRQETTHEEPEGTVSEENECSDEDWEAGTDESDDNDDHDSVGSSCQDHDSDSNTATQPGDSRVRHGEGSCESAGPAKVSDAWDELRPLIGLPAPAPREAPQALNTQRPVKPYSKPKDKDVQNEDGEQIENKYDYEEAINELLQRHKFLRRMFRRWYMRCPPRFTAFKANNTYESRLKKYKRQTYAAEHEAAEHEAAPGVCGGGYFQNVITSLRSKLTRAMTDLHTIFMTLIVKDALFMHEKESPAGGGEIPAGGGGGQASAAAAMDLDSLGRSDDCDAAAAKRAKLAHYVFRYRLSKIRTKSYILLRNTSPNRYWLERKSARFEISRNPLRFSACMDQRHAPGNSAWSKICVAAHCMSHRLHNATKGFFCCLNNGLFSQVQATAACIKNLFVWMPMKTAIDLLLGGVAEHENPGRNSLDTEFYDQTRLKIQEQRGVTLDAVREEVAYDSVKGISEPSTCIDIRWGTVANSASDLLRHHRVYAFGMIKRFSKGITDAKVAAAAAVFSETGFVSGDFGNVQIDKQVQRAFGTVTKITELAQLAIVDFVNVLCIRPMMKGISSDNDCAVNEMMGVDSIVRRMIYLFGRGIWLRSGMRGWNNKQAVLCRTDGGEFDPDPKSMKLLNVNCDVNSILGSAGNENTSGAVRKLLEVFKMLANSGQEVIPEDLLSALQVARKGRSEICCPSSDRDKVSFATNMSKLMYVTSLVAEDVVEALRFDFDREIFTIQGLIGGMLKQRTSSHTILNDEGVPEQCKFVSADPIALANAFVLLVLARDLAAHHAPELIRHGAEIEDFMSSYHQVIGKKCRDQIERFVGIQKGESRSVRNVRLAPKSFTLNKRFRTYEKRINGETTELSMPLRIAQCSCCSSKSVEQTFSTPSIVGRGKGHSSLRVVNARFRMKSVKSSGLDLKKTDPLLFKVARKFAKHPELRRVFEKDRVKEDAMHADYMIQNLPVYIGKKNGNWKSTGHEKPCRPDRFVKIAEGSQEETYLKKLTRKLCIRTGAENQLEKQSDRRSSKRPTDGSLQSQPRKAPKSGKRSSAVDALGRDSERVDAGARSSSPVASAAASEEYSEDGGGESAESPKIGESQVQVQEAATASALAESAARFQPDNASLNVSFNAGPASSEVLPAPILYDGCGGVECDAIEDARHAPAPSGGDESMADSCGQVQVQEAATTSALAESAARADEAERIQPDDTSSNVSFNAGPASSEVLPDARLHDGGGGAECVAMEDAGHAPAPVEGIESMADSLGACDTLEEIKVLEDGNYGDKWSIDILYLIHEKIWEEDSDHRTWQHSKVVFKKDLGPWYGAITRVPGFRYNGNTRIAFNVRPNSGRNHYILYDQWAGAKLVSVEAVRQPDDDDWSKTIEFRQIFTTAEAIEISETRGGGTKGHMGKKELQKLLTEDQSRSPPQTTYHNGDYLHNGDIRDVIGVFRWAKANTRENELQSCPAEYYPKSDLIFIGSHIDEGYR